MFSEFCSISALSCSFEFVWWWWVGGGGIPSDYLASTQLQLWLFCCWDCGCCWAVTIRFYICDFETLNSYLCNHSKPNNRSPPSPTPVLFALGRILPSFCFQTIINNQLSHWRPTFQNYLLQFLSNEVGIMLFFLSYRDPETIKCC